uniref:Uncharacterized protein n=1 Tax=Anguilla anguilla TaxID=7936 RepID=A0A0E9WBU2_ANGAN
MTTKTPIPVSSYHSTHRGALQTRRFPQNQTLFLQSI